MGAVSSLRDRIRAGRPRRLVTVAVVTVLGYTAVVVSVDRILRNDTDKNMNGPDFAVGLAGILVTVLFAAAAQPAPALVGANGIGANGDGGRMGMPPAPRVYAVLTAVLLCTVSAVVLWTSAKDSGSGDGTLPEWLRYVSLLIAAVGVVSVWIFMTEGHRLYMHSGPGIHRLVTGALLAAAGYLLLRHLIEERLGVDKWYIPSEWLEVDTWVDEPVGLAERFGVLIAVLLLVTILRMVRIGRQPAAVRWIGRYLFFLLISDEENKNVKRSWWDRVVMTAGLGLAWLPFAVPAAGVGAWVSELAGENRLVDTLITIGLYAAAGWAVLEAGSLLHRGGPAWTRWLVPVIAWLAAIGALVVTVGATALYVAATTTAPSPPVTCMVGTWNVVKVFYRDLTDYNEQVDEYFKKQQAEADARRSQGTAQPGTETETPDPPNPPDPQWYVSTGPTKMQLEFRDDGSALLIAATGWDTYRTVPAQQGGPAPAVLPKLLRISDLVLPSIDKVLEYETSKTKLTLTAATVQTGEEQEQAGAYKDEARLLYYCRPAELVLIGDTRLVLSKVPEMIVGSPTPVATG